MAAQEPARPEPATDGAQTPLAAATGRRRLGNPTRLVPRRPPRVEPDIDAENAEATASHAASDPIAPRQSETRRLSPLFAPRGVGNGRIQVWGFAPGCLVVSLIASVVLTILLNIVF